MWRNTEQARLTNLHEWVQVSLSAPFIRPCAISCQKKQYKLLNKKRKETKLLLWTPTHGCAGVGRPARTYIQQLCEDTGCNPEDLPEAMNDREKWRETVRDIRAGGATWWWWYIYIYIYQKMSVIYFSIL